MAKTTKKDETTSKKAAPKKAEPQDKTAKAAKAETAGASKGAETKAKKAKGTPGAKRAPLAPRTFFAATGTFNNKWKVIDATGLTLGRLSTQVAHVLMGEHLPQYTRHAGTGDSVIVLNAGKVVVTGKKLTDKVYQWHTGYPGGVKTFTVQEMLDRHPERLVERAVYGMLPKGHIGRQWVKRLHVYAGAEHPHKAQQPETLSLPGGTSKNA
jgi:large subunit ribosomal protein L13